MVSVEQLRYRRGRELRAAVHAAVDQLQAQFPEFKLTVICRNTEDDRGHAVACEGDITAALDLYEYSLYQMAQMEARMIADQVITPDQARFFEHLRDRLEGLQLAAQERGGARPD